MGIARNLGAAVVATFLAANAACAQSPKLMEKPVTVTVNVSEDVRRAPVIFLQLENVVTPRNGPAIWSVFLELPTAGQRTSVNSDHFVGHVTVLANSAATTNPPKGFTLQLPEPASRLLRNRTTARLTFVPAEKFADNGVTIGTIRFEAVKP